MSAMDELSAENVARALKRFGVKHRLNKSCEEMAESIVAIHHYFDGRPGSFEAMVSELVQVEFLLRQIETSHGEAWREVRQREMERMKARLDAWDAADSTAQESL